MPGRRGLNANWVGQFTTCEGDVERMAGHITQGTGSKGPEPTPLERVISAVVGTHLDRPDELVPVQMSWNRLFFWTWNALWPDWPVRPNVDFLDVAENTRLELCSSRPQTRFLRTLVPHLGRSLRSCREFRQFACFPNSPRQRLLSVTRFAQTKSHRGCNCVSVVRRTYSDRIDFLAYLVEELSVVVEHLRIFEIFILLPLSDGVVINIANCDDLPIVCCILRIAGALTSNTDAREPDFFESRSALLWSYTTCNPVPGANCSGGLKETTTI